MRPCRKTGKAADGRMHEVNAEVVLRKRVQAFFRF